MNPLVYVVLLNWQRPHDVLSCLRSLHALEYDAKKIVVVNNGSSDELREVVSASRTDVSVIEAGRNRGFSGGNNLAFRQAIVDGAKYIWIVNDDLTLPSDCLSTLVAAAEADPQAGLLSPVVYHKDHPDLVWNAGGKFRTETCGFDWFLDVNEADAFQRAHPDRFMLAGTALLIRTDLVARIGGLGEDMFAYHEDIDYSMRAQSAGFTRQLVTNASVYHDHQPTGRQRPHVAYYLARNDILIWRRHVATLPMLKKRYWASLRMLRDLRRYRDDPELWDASLTGWWHGQCGTAGERDPQRRAPAVIRWAARAASGWIS